MPLPSKAPSNFFVSIKDPSGASRRTTKNRRVTVPLSSRAALMAKVAKVTAQHGTAPTRPPFWGGYRIRPVEIEFWADGEHRLHDRFRWTRADPQGRDWTVTRLNP